MLLNDEQKMIRDMTRDFARTQIMPEAALRAEEKRFPAKELAKLAELGILGMLVPEEYGGSDTGYLSYVLAMEEVAAADGALSTIISVNSCPVSTALLTYASAQQKQEWLPKLTSGEWIGAFALSEPDAGSDASAIRCRAEKQGDSYLLNGTKQFITSGKNGHLALVFAITDPDAGKRGLSCFAVPTDHKGYVVARVEGKMGQESSDTCQIILDNLLISEAYRVGEEGEGYKIALANLEGGRLGIAAQSIGMARGAYEQALNYAQERKTFGKSLLGHQALSFRLVDMATQIEVARQMLHHAAALRDAGLACKKEACMAKLFASEMAEKVAREALQIFGGYGYLKEYPIERIYRDVRVCSIYEGTSDIQRIVIGREILKDSQDAA
jgi:butyryl-CoA dehydrogenase